jgi:uncharacterized membrane protein YgcG
LSPDEYEYQIRYATDFQLGFFETHDELYWNITGNGWLFPIDAVSARITLPAPADGGVLSIEGYTGAPGSTEQAVSTEIESERSARVTSSRPLAPGEGLTLVFSFPKGIVAEPTERERSQRLLADNTGLLLGLLGFIAVSVYFFFVWLRVGRDPAAGVIFPQYQAPPGLSPAAARYVRRMGYDSKTFTAAVISLAVKGQLELDDQDDNYTVRLANRSGRRPTQAPGSALSAGERAILKRLFADDAAVTLDKSNTVLLLKAQAAHRNALKLENYRVYFANNTIFVLPPILIVIFTGIAMAGFPPPNPIGIGLLIVSLIEVPIFGWLLKAPTQLGRKLLDKIEGLKLYLSVAEKDELALQNPPEKTPELFEAFLPYALALGVEETWADRFDEVFRRMQMETGRAYQPVWYHGHGSSAGHSGSPAALTAGMATAVTSAIAAASVPPGSSSGGGGGGFSGGGGGGGGGGGW